MGIAKSIQAYSVYENYNSNIDSFIKDLSNKLNADFILNIYDKDFELIGVENTLTRFGKSNQYRLTINFEEYIIENDIDLLPTYEISFPINYIYEDTLELSFYPNNSVHITFLTFEQLWGAFIDCLKFQSVYSDRKDDLKRYQTLRNEYINIFKSIGIKHILISTHAYYEIENITNPEELNGLTFNDIIKYAIEKDKVSIFDFSTILNASNIVQLDKIFLEKSDLEIMLVDKI